MDSFDANWLCFNFFSKIRLFLARKYSQEMNSEKKYKIIYFPSVMVLMFCKGRQLAVQSLGGSWGYGLMILHGSKYICCYIHHLTNF